MFLNDVEYSNRVALFQNVFDYMSSQESTSADDKITLSYWGHGASRKRRGVNLKKNQKPDGKTSSSYKQGTLANVRPHIFVANAKAISGRAGHAHVTIAFTLRRAFGSALACFQPLSSSSPPSSTILAFRVAAALDSQRPTYDLAAYISATICQYASFAC